MSFGWSASDLAQTIGLIVKIVKALDEADGAAADYREAIKFLGSLKHTLEPLQTFAVLDLYTEYRDEIRQHVEEIRVPIESFLVLASKFEPSLGLGATTGRLRNINRKLQWRFHTSEKVVTLRKHIGGHMVILGTLLARLTLETILSIHKQNSSTTIIDPPLLDLLKEQLLPIRERVVTVSQTLETQHQSILSNLEKQNTLIQESCNERARSAQEAGQQHEIILSKFENQDTLMQRSFDELSLSEKETRRQHESFLVNLERQNVLHQKSSDELSIHTKKADQQQTRILSELEKQRLSLEEAVKAIKAHTTGVIETLQSGSNMKTPGARSLNGNIGDTDRALVTLGNAAATDEKKESLRELYYLVLLYLGSFLRDAILLLCRKVRPPPTLVPTLLARYHISFSDALGRVRVLDYDCFANLDMFRTFIQTSFTGVAGES